MATVYGNRRIHNNTPQYKEIINMAHRIVWDLLEAHSRSWQVIGTAAERARWEMKEKGLVIEHSTWRTSDDLEIMNIIVRRDPDSPLCELGHFFGGRFEIDAVLTPCLDSKGKVSYFVGMTKTGFHLVYPNLHERYHPMADHGDIQFGGVTFKRPAQLPPRLEKEFEDDCDDEGEDGNWDEEAPDYADSEEFDDPRDEPNFIVAVYPIQPIPNEPVVDEMPDTPTEDAQLEPTEVIDVPKFALTRLLSWATRRR